VGWWYQGCRALARIIACGAWRIRTYGRENVPRAGGVLLASNHQSYLDPVLIAAAADREVHFMARSSLFRVPALGPLISSLRAFSIERGKADMRGVREAVERLRDGHVVLVFPEGTRTRNGRVAPMKAGIRILCERSDAPIVPVLLEGAYRAWPKGRPVPVPWPINVVFGRPFRLEPASAGDAGERVRREVIDLKIVTRRRVETEESDGE